MKKLLPLDWKYWEKITRVVATTYNNMGVVLESMGDYDGALEKHKQALAIRLSALGRIILMLHLPTTTLVLCWRIGDNEGALSKYEEALALTLSALGKDHPDVATTYNSIGFVLYDMDDFEGALSKHKEALAIQLLVLGKDHPDVAQSYDNMGGVLEEMDENEGALSKYEEALAVRSSALGKDHADVAISYHKIGAALFSMGHYEDSLLKFQECLAIREPMLGLEHPETKKCIGWVEAIKEKQLAEELFRLEQELWKKFKLCFSHLQFQEEVVWWRNGGRAEQRNLGKV
ncbi:Hydra magnipapillata [Seminavis robusta]|uniref:Hydra magnipapillata n=1 Tax=Seminavis robusta TaxID=568900 RepID=A0A9N8EBD5_9STRA|nr:Hydra magnipapillata [Seminavis robusta]|eukprot:Sro845_g210020.1 Hydra magnipapillata (289) ;mRNA; r:24587-25573